MRRGVTWNRVSPISGVRLRFRGSATYGVAGALDSEEPHPAHLRLRQETWDPNAYARAVPALFEHLRLTLGDRVELLA